MRILITGLFWIACLGAIGGLAVYYRRGWRMAGKALQALSSQPEAATAETLGGARHEPVRRAQLASTASGRTAPSL